MCKFIKDFLDNSIQKPFSKCVRRDFERMKVTADLEMAAVDQLVLPATNEYQSLEFINEAADSLLVCETDRQGQLDSRLLGVLQIAALAIPLTIGFLAFIPGEASSWAVLVNLLVLIIVVFKVIWQTMLVLIPYVEYRFGKGDFLDPALNQNDYGNRLQDAIRKKLKFQINNFCINEYKQTHFLKCFVNLLWLLVFAGIFATEAIWCSATQSASEANVATSIIISPEQSASIVLNSKEKVSLPQGTIQISFKQSTPDNGKTRTTPPLRRGNKTLLIVGIFCCVLSLVIDEVVAWLVSMRL